jgi:RNA polymerase sigma-70 factor (ECF subfamily)
MARESRSKNLANITTHWSLVRRAHAGPPDERASAQQQLLDRYGGAVRRYLLGMLHDSDAADDLFQEFALRFVRGDLKNADPHRGRFRDYLKGVLGHLVADYRRRRRDQPLPLYAATPELALVDSSPEEHERACLESWRDELLARTWNALAGVELQTGQPFYTVLRFRADHPQMRSPDMAVQLSALAGRPFTAVGVRQIIRRARQRFADLLLDEVVHSLADPTEEAVERELIDLHLLEYCRPALDERFEPSSLQSPTKSTHPPSHLRTSPEWDDDRANQP